jgi:hypothetical protein
MLQMLFRESTINFTLIAFVVAPLWIWSWGLVLISYWFDPRAFSGRLPWGLDIAWQWVAAIFLDVWFLSPLALVGFFLS